MTDEVRNQRGNVKDMKTIKQLFKQAIGVKVASNEELSIIGVNYLQSEHKDI